MNLFARLGDTVVDYLPSFAKRRRTMGPTTPSKESERAMFSPASEPQVSQKLASLNIKYESYTLSSNRNPRKRAREEFEGERSGLTPYDSISQRDISEDEDVLESTEELDVIHELDGGSLILNGGDEEDEIEEVDEDAAAQAKVQEYLARQAELEMRKEDIERARAAGDWHRDELFLFERLTMRSFEELIPLSWDIDFPTMPDQLFTDDPHKTFINYNCKSSSHGAKALQQLLRLGVRVREKVAAGVGPEPLVEREIKNYIRYTEKDGGYDRKRFLPVITVVKARPFQEMAIVNKTITDEMNFLAIKHREHLEFSHDEISEPDANMRIPPLLYGMIVVRTMVIFVTFDSANPNGHMRHLTHFDFMEKKMDVWNGFAIAIMSICARNYTMAIKDELEDDDEPMSDPDL